MLALDCNPNPEIRGLYKFKTSLGHKVKQHLKNKRMNEKARNKKEFIQINEKVYLKL